MSNISFKKEKINIETITNDKIVKLQWVPNLGPKLRKEFKKNWHKKHFYFGT